MKKFKTIGVLGGMGHCATSHFFQLLLKTSQKKFNSVQDDEYPQIIINSLALVGATEEGMEKNDLITNQLIEGITGLEKAGADFVVIPCNSVHNSLEKIKSNTNLPIVSIIEKVTERVLNSSTKKVLLLSSETTNKYGLYKNLYGSKVQIIKPDIELERKVTKLILAVMGSKNVSIAKKPVVNTINNLYKTKKIDSVILGCTELPVAINKHDTNAKIFDSLSILADAAIEFSGGR